MLSGKQATAIGASAADQPPGGRCATAHRQERNDADHEHRGAGHTPFELQTPFTGGTAVSRDLAADRRNRTDREHGKVDALDDSPP